MNRKLRYYQLVLMKHDLPAGLSVFFVALPLCLGIAMASGVPLYAGLLSGIVGGVLVALLSGSALGVSGPAAGLTTLVAAAIASMGRYELFLLSVIIAGAFQLILGLLKLGGIANYFPSSVIKGMLAAIGIILISKQIPVALGYNHPNFWTSGFLHLFSSTDVSHTFYTFSKQITTGAFLVSMVCLGILIYFHTHKNKSLKMIPAPLLVVLVGVLVNSLFMFFNQEGLFRNTQLVNIPENIFDSIVFPDFSKAFSSTKIWENGLMIGLLATLETLLCVEAVDKLDKHNRITPVNRELIAQGIGNMVCGLIGAIPITAVVVRGSANIDAGGKTKLSAFTHGIFLLLAVLFVPFLLNKIPYATLAAILLLTGYNLAKPKLFFSMWSLGLKQFLSFIITIFVILATDLLVGVSIGLLLSVYFIVQENFKSEFKIVYKKEFEIDVYILKLNTSVTFLNKVKFRKTLDEIPPYSVLHIDGSDSEFIDHDILEIISEFHNKAHDKHIEIHLKNIKKVAVMAGH